LPQVLRIGLSFQLVWGVLVCSSLWTQTAQPQAAVGILPPIGTNTFLTDVDFLRSSTYASSNRLVATSYFYWYDVFSNAHLVNSDGSDALTDHPPTLTGFSYRSKAWHKTQLLDMMTAGIDILLPVYWGAPSERLTNKPPAEQSWSYAGLIPLVQAREELLAEGKNPPRIGMFYDTSTLQYNAWNRHIDLTTDYGRRWFYESVRDFFSLVAPKHWAMIDGKPVVFLYSASFAVRHDQSCIDYLRSCFASEFAGRTPYLVREISWNVQTEQVYAWGGALGPKNPGVASLGPGYDHSAVPGRTPLVVSREGGQFFTRNWESFLRRPSALVAIETWNEFHEGTDIAASREYGRTYLELNRKFVDMFKQGIVPPRPNGPFTNARTVDIRLGTTNREDGLRQFEWADGFTVPASIGDSDCRELASNPTGGRYLYFNIDDSFKWAPKMTVVLTVEYYDTMSGVLRVQFDGSDTNAPLNGAYTTAGKTVSLSGTETWKVATFTLSDALFLNSQNGGGDFRLTVSGGDLYVRNVQLVRPGLGAGRYSDQAGFQLSLYGAADQSYALEYSHNLTEWRVMTLLRAEADGTPYADGTARQAPCTWYRARPLP
jgi:hypothetical protein